jgi:hypothetical protein
VALGEPGRDRHAVLRLLLARLVDEQEPRRPHRDLVTILQIVLADALAPEERAVQRPQVAQQEPAVARALDLRVFLRDDPIEDLDRVVGMPAQGVERPELELLALVAGDDDQLGHAFPERLRCYVVG